MIQGLSETKCLHALTLSPITRCMFENKQLKIMKGCFSSKTNLRSILGRNLGSIVAFIEQSYPIKKLQKIFFPPLKRLVFFLPNESNYHFSIKDFSTEKTLKEKFIFLCSVSQRCVLCIFSDLFYTDILT